MVGLEMMKTMNMLFVRKARDKGSITMGKVGAIYSCRLNQLVQWLTKANLTWPRVSVRWIKLAARGDCNRINNSSIHSIKQETRSLTTTITRLWAVVAAVKKLVEAVPTIITTMSRVRQAISMEEGSANFSSSSASTRLASLSINLPTRTESFKAWSKINSHLARRNLF